MLGGVFHLHEQEAREVMTPIPAVVTVNLTETVEDALQRCVSSGHTRLVAIENDNPDRVRGVVHNNSLVRLYMNTGADASIESAIREVPIVAGDEAARRPARRASAPAQLDRRSSSTSTGARSASSPSRTSSRRSSARSRTRPTRARRCFAALPTATGTYAATSRSATLKDAGIELPVDSDAYNSVGGYVFSELGRLPKRGDRIQANGHEIRVESVRENRIVAVRIQPLTTEQPALPAPESSRRL